MTFNGTHREPKTRAFGAGKSAPQPPANSLNSPRFLGSARRVDGDVNLGETQRSSLTLRRRREASKSPNDKRTGAVNIGAERQARTCDLRMNRAVLLFRFFFPRCRFFFFFLLPTSNPDGDETTSGAEGRAAGMWAGPQRGARCSADVVSLTFTTLKKDGVSGRGLRLLPLPLPLPPPLSFYDGAQTLDNLVAPGYHHSSHYLAKAIPFDLCEMRIIHDRKSSCVRKAPAPA